MVLPLLLLVVNGKLQEILMQQKQLQILLGNLLKHMLHLPWLRKTKQLKEELLSKPHLLLMKLRKVLRYIFKPVEFKLTTMLLLLKLQLLPHF